MPRRGRVGVSETGVAMRVLTSTRGLDMNCHRVVEPMSKASTVGITVKDVIEEEIPAVIGFEGYEG